MFFIWTSLFLEFISRENVAQVSVTHFCTTHRLPRIRLCPHARAFVASCDVSPSFVPKPTTKGGARWGGPPYPRCRGEGSSRRGRQCASLRGSPSPVLSSPLVSSSFWAVSRTHARQSPANRMHCKMNVGFAQSHYSSHFTLHRAQRVRNLSGPVQMVKLSFLALTPPPLFFLLCFPQTDRGELTVGHKNVEYTLHSTTHRRHRRRRRRPVGRRAAAGAVCAVIQGRECGAGARFACG